MIRDLIRLDDRVQDGRSAHKRQREPSQGEDQLNGRFDGVPPAGDDVVVNRFEVAPLGVGDSEGVAFDSDTGNLYVIGRDRHLIEVTTTGVLVRTIDISALPFVAPADVVYAPGSLNLLIKHLYIVDRGVDNNVDPFENDGKIYEITLNPIECILPPPL